MNAFLIPHIRSLVESGHRVDLAFNIEADVDQELVDLGCRVYDIPFQRSPFKGENLIAYEELKRVIDNYDIVHTHTPIASFLTRMACRRKPKVKVVYTAHGFHFFKGAPMENWIIYYTAERFASRYTDLLITINKEDYKRASNSFQAKQVEYIPGIGLNLEKFKAISIDKEEKLKDLGIFKDDFVVLSAGELNDNKNHKTVIKSLAKLEDDSIKYLICGEGLLKDDLENLIDELNLSDNVKLLGERKDLPEIYNVCDALVLPSKREGLGMVSLEAMASGLPIITSNVHGIVDYSIDGVTGFTCDPTDVDCFSRAIKKLKDNPDLRTTMGENNRASVDKFELKNVVSQMESIYSNLISGIEENER